MSLQTVGVRFVAQDVDRYIRDVNQGSKAVEKFSESAEKSGGRVNAASEIIIGGLRRIGEMSVNALVGAGRAFGGFLADSVNVAAEYESTLNRFASVTGDALQQAGMELQDFSDLFLRLGSETQFSAQDAADAAVELTKGGVSVQEVMNGALEATLNLAAAGQLELAPAAEILAKQMGIWAEHGIEAAEITDLLAQAANASTVDVEELALGLSNVGGVGEVAGLSFREVVTTMAMLAPGFSSAADAGTSFKTFLMSLNPTTDKATQAMADLGLWTESTGSVFYDAQGQFIGMEAASQKLYEATAHLSEQERILAFETIFGTDAIRAAAIIAEQGGDGYRKMAEDMTAAGSAADQAALLNQGFAFALDQAKGSLETLQIVLGTALLPVLSDFLNNYITPGINAIMAFAQAVIGSDNPLQTFKEGIKAGATELGTWIINAIPGVLQSLGDLARGLVEWVSFNLPTWQRNLELFTQAAINWIGQAMPGIMQNLASVMQGMIGWVMSNLGTWAGALLQFGLKIVGWISDQLPSLANALGQYFNSMVNWVVDSIPTWALQLKEFGIKAVGWVIDILPELIQNLGVYAVTLLGWIGKTAIDVVPKLIELGFRFIAWIHNDVLPKLPGALLQVATAIFNWIAGLVNDAKPRMQTLAVRFYAWVTEDVIPALPGKLLSIATTLGNWIIETKTQVQNRLKDLAKRFYAWVTEDAAPKLPGVLRDLGAKIWEWITSAAKDAYSKARSIGTQLVSGIVQGIKDNAGTIASALVNPVGAAIGAARNYIRSRSPSRLTAEEIGQPMTEGISTGILEKLTEAVNALLQVLQSMMQEGQANLGGFQPIGEQAATEIAEGVRSNTGEVAGAVGNAIEEAADEGRATIMMLPDVGAEAVSAIADGVNSGGGGLHSAFSALVGSLGNLFEGGLVGRLRSAAERALSEAGSIIGGSDIGGGGGSGGGGGGGRFGGGFPGFGGFRASGGSVSRGMAYVVGEKGWELFRPNTDGYIYSHADSQRISPPASASQVMTSYNYNSTYAPQYNYSPSYNGTPRQPSQDFALMQVRLGGE